MKHRYSALAALFGAAALTLGSAAVAHAHVTASSDSAVAGGYAVVTLAVPHGCDGSATTAVAIQIPEGINSVTPTRNPLYTVEKVMEKLPTPITDAHGNELTERVAQVVYTTTTPLPDGQRDAFELSMKLPDDAGDTTLYFPTVQTCEQGESAWVEIPAEGQDPHDLALPAPALAVAPGGDTHGHDHATPTASPSAHDEHSSEGGHDSHAAEAGSSNAVGIAALVVGSLGLLAGLIALIRVRPRA